MSEDTVTITKSSLVMARLDRNMPKLTIEIVLVKISYSLRRRGLFAMRGPKPESILVAFFAAVVYLLPLSASAAEVGSYEIPQERKAADILPAELLKGEHHSVDDRVRSDGYLNYYTITSDYGDFEAASTATLRIRIGEISALAELDELSKTEVFIKAAADAGIVAPLKSMSQIATHPVETVTGIPSGIGRMFKRYKRQAGEAVDTTKEMVADDNTDQTDDESEDDSNVAVDLTVSYFGVTSAERAWSQKLGTDPYSTNQTLRAAIKEVAWAESIGQFGTRFVGIPGIGVIGQVNEVVWSKDPYELQDLNRARLIATGADEELIKEYLDNPLMSPTQQTLLTASIAELADVEGRAGILTQALNVKTDAEARFFVRTVALLAWYHNNQRPIVSVITQAATPGGLTDDGNVAMLFAVDHVYWTEVIAQEEDMFAGLGTAAGDNSPEAWFLGTASDRCRNELLAAGWEVHENLAHIIATESQ